MKKQINLYLIASFFCFLITGCSGNDNVEPEPGTEWDKTRTARVTFVSDLTGNNPYTTNNYNAVSSAIKGNDSHVIILDRANVTYETPRINPGANIAVSAERFPIFVPVSTTETEYRGSVVLYEKPVPEMEQTVVADVCRMIPIAVEIKQGLTVRTALLSFDSENQISVSANLFRSAQTSSTLVTGTIRRNLVPTLESIISTLTDGSYTLEIIENSDRNSEYAIYLFGSMKWKFRDFTEGSVSGNIKNFLLQVEFL
ncbi:putative secreted protein [Proteiniphilum saccharofermentans]|uniref:Putative secreted protein n=1 Tax=Proteiniphilum saccharofermentans TaxID=1642647 RepID=A0A1R3T740_9BACT|nr:MULTISPECIES: hypothetical protein [Proteiniphilum]SCD20407.1 putative secreted protein [Proteiniphilum saccharofermentans]